MHTLFVGKYMRKRLSRNCKLKRNCNIEEKTDSALKCKLNFNVAAKRFSTLMNNFPSAVTGFDMVEI